MTTTKQQRGLKKQMQLFKLSIKMPEINKIVESARPFVAEYYRIIREQWGKKIDSCYTPFELAELLKKPELKQLNKQYRELLKEND